MCFFHVTQAIKPKIESLSDPEIQHSLNIDIREIQRCQSTQLFNKAIQLFNKKYSNINTRVNEFIDYFNKQWVKSHPGWYEGFLGKKGPSTNNGVESLNAHIKRSKTLRKKLSLRVFLDLIIKMVTESSKNNDEGTNCTQFRTHKTIGTKEFTDAYQFKREAREIQSNISEEFRNY